MVAVEIPDELPSEQAVEPSTENEADAIIEDQRAENPKSPIDYVYLLDEDTGEPWFAGKFATGMVNAEFLARKFKRKGKYRVITKKPDEKGRMVYAGNQVIRVMGDLMEPVVQTGDPIVRGESRVGDSSFIEKMLLSQMDANAKLMASITEAFGSLGKSAPAPAPTIDPLLLKILDGMFSRKDPMEIATELINKMGTGKDPFDMLTKLLELQKLLPSSNDTDDQSPMALVGKGIDAIRAGFESSRAQLPARTGLAPVATPVPVVPVQTPAVQPVAAVAALPAPEIDPNMRTWKKEISANLPVLLSASAFMPPEAAALTAKANLSASGHWADVIEDVRSDYPILDVDAALPENFGEAFIARTMKDFGLSSASADVKEWVEATLEEIAVLVVTPEDEGEDEPKPEPST